jgi:SAM-dependent methyltransferase
MKFSELIELRAALRLGYKLHELLPLLEVHSQQFNNLPIGIAEQYQQYINAVNQNVDTMRNSIDESHRTAEALIDKLNKDIMQAANIFSADEYLHSVNADLNAVQNVRQLPITAEIQTELELIISNYNSWQYPSLEINAVTHQWTAHMVSGDPLYILAQHQELLDSIISTFPIDYQRRVRPYLMQGADLSFLPQEQFGFVLVWNHFNYFNLSQIQQHLESILRVLRPGGVLMFSYNDADTVIGARMAENHNMSYAPYSLVFPLLQHMGFEIIRHQHRESNLSWFEVRRPGCLTTIKTGQVLGELRAVGL